MDDDDLPRPYRKATTVEGPMQTWVDQMPLRHKAFTPPLHVVILVQTNLRPQARAHVVLLSSELDLADAPLVDDDGLRCPIACNVRDAKQSWGLEDVMTVPPAGGTHAANLSLCRVHVAYRLRADLHAQDPASSVLDLKADCRGSKDVEETRKMLPEKPEPVL